MKGLTAYIDNDLSTARDKAEYTQQMFFSYTQFYESAVEHATDERLTDVTEMLETQVNKAFNASRRGNDAFLEAIAAKEDRDDDMAAEQFETAQSRFEKSKQYEYLTPHEFNEQYS